MFYSVIETRDFSLFNQSAQALLKGYFINCYSLWYINKIVYGKNWGTVFLLQLFSVQLGILE